MAFSRNRLRFWGSVNSSATDRFGWTHFSSRVMKALLDPIFVHVSRLAQVMFELDILISMTLLAKWIELSLSIPSIVLAVLSVFLFISYQTHEKLRRLRSFGDLICSFCWFALFALLHVYANTNYPWVGHFLLGMLWLGTALSGVLRKRKAHKLIANSRRERSPIAGTSEAWEEPANDPGTRQAMELPENTHRAELASSHLF